MIQSEKDAKNDAKRKTLELVRNALELGGLDPNEYDLALYKKTRLKVAPNIQLFQTAAYLAATCLSPSANKILMYFLSISQFENCVGIDQKSLHENLGISLSATEKGLRELVGNGVIIKMDNTADGRRRDYFINPMQAWKGKMLNRKKALAILDKNDPDQLHLFGEKQRDGEDRELEEIKLKRPNLFLEMAKKHANDVK